ncbi:MAG: hypothetical protein EA409_10465 [Saprospirales bacterium]|nr:MAG: hypothetical protein EA409_10465 [Saprospirales bacterium]
MPEMTFENIKVVQVIRTFSTAELNRLEKFIQSPYFNVNHSITALFDLIKNAVRTEDYSTLDKLEVYDQLFKGKKYSDTKFRKVCSDLLKLTEEFLAIEQFKANPLHEASYLLQAISKRRIEPLYNSVLKSTRRLSERQYEIAPSYYYYQYEIEKNYFNMMESEMTRDRRLNLEQIAKNLDYFFIAEKLRYYSTALSQKRFTKHDYEILFMDEILDHLKDNPYDDIPQITINKEVVNVYRFPEDDAHYFKLKGLIFKEIERFPKDDSRDVFNAALNFCIKKLNQGDQKFLKEVFYLYDFALKNDYLFIQGELTPWTFKNIVVVALRLKEYQWTENFIDEYSGLLNEKHRDNAVRFNLARMHGYKGNFKKVLELLRTVEFDDISYNLGAKAMLLVSYYELEEIDALLSFLDTFRVFLNRQKNKLPEQRRKNYLNLIKYTKKLANIDPFEKEALSKLKTEITESKNVADVNWLTEKVVELEKWK